MKKLEQYQKKLFDGGMLKKEELMELADEPLDELCQAADEVRRGCREIPIFSPFTPK